MTNQKCRDCKANKICRHEKSSWIFIIIGLISTIAVRVVTVLMKVEPIYGEVAWYIGISGFSVFFLYKYIVFRKREEMIHSRKLLEKVNHHESLMKEDYELLTILLCEIQSKRERINFLFIFILSILALIIAIYFDFVV